MNIRILYFFDCKISIYTKIIKDTKKKRNAFSIILLANYLFYLISFLTLEIKSANKINIRDKYERIVSEDNFSKIILKKANILRIGKEWKPRHSPSGCTPSSI